MAPAITGAGYHLVPAMRWHPACDDIRAITAGKAG